MDDMPVGGKGGGENMMQAPSSSDQADSTGPLEKRIVSKNWKTRADAYDELSALCDNAKIDSKEPFFSEYVIMWKEILKDSNPGALEKALSCLEKFLAKCKSAIILDYQNNIISSLIEKCFGHAKPIIKQKASECLLLLYECSENFEISVDTLIALATNKNLKVQIGGTQAIAILVENFSVKKIKITLYADIMIKNAQNTNPDVKKAAYDYYKAVYKWIGDIILPQIKDKLKPQQIEELQKLFDEVKASGNKNKRVVRSEKAQEEEAKKNALIDAAMAEENKAADEVIDPLEFAPEIDILAQFNVEWQENTAAIKKWDEKVQKFNDLINASKNAKIKPGNFENLSQLLKKEINATHVSITASAIEASTFLAIGLKKEFQPYIKHLMNPVLLKYKEKKQVVVDKINSFLDASLQCTDLEQIKDDITMGLTNAAPLVKQGTIKFLEKAAVITYIDVLQRISEDILPPMIKAVDDKDSTVRDAALHCVGILKGRYGDAIMAKFLKGIDVKQKLEKIDEAQKEVKPSKYDRPENWKPPAPKKVVEKKKANEDEDELMNFDQKPKKAPPKNLGQKPIPKIEEDQIMESTQNDEDQLMSFDIKPKKAPPKNIGIKPKKQEDEEMKSEEVVAPKKTAPALTQQKPKAVVSSGSSKPPSAPVIEEEDLGSGLSKEEACEKVQEFFNSSTTELFDKDKWQDKKQGFEELEKEIIEKQPNQVTLEAVAKFIKTKMKDWKESNINLQKAIVSIFDCIVTNCERVNKRTIQCAMSYFIDKIGDVKMQESIKTMLMTAAELVTPKYISLQIIKYAATAKSPNNLTQSCVVLTDIVEDFGVGGIPLKETIDYGKIATAHATPTVRQSAMKLFCSIYKQVGDVIKNFMNDIKESTLKMIYDEFDKLTVYKKGDHQKKRQVRGEAAEQEQAQVIGKKGKGVAAEDDILASLPREDISKKLNSKLMEQFKNKDWKIRKKGGDDVEAILREAKMRIEPNGLNELMENIKMLMKDPNKAVVKVFIALLGLLADAIGSPIKQYIKKCFVPMLNNLSDKQSLVRQDVIVTMNKWAEAIGADQIINNISPILLIENPEFRQEGLNWIMQNTSALQTCDHQSLLKPLISCLLDKSKEIRTKTEEIISLVMPVLGYQEFLNATKDQKPAVQQTLKPILEKIKSQCNAGQGPAPSSGGVIQQENDEQKQTMKKDLNNNKKQISQTLPIKIEKEEQKQVIGSFQKLALEKKNLDKKGNESMRESIVPKPSQRLNANEDDEVKINPQNKSKRALQDGRSKYPVNEVKGDHIEKLQQVCNDIFGVKFSDLLFAKSVDFQKHIKCVETLDKLIMTQFDQIVEVLDIIFKWGVLRMNESSNTKLLMSIFDFYGNLVNQLIENQYKMQEFEMIILISTLCEKNGHNIQIMKEKSRKLTKLCFDLYDKKALYRLIVENGVKSKNLKAVSECLEEISDFIQQNGIDAITKKDFELYLKTLDNADKSVREGSLKVFGESYTILGEEIWRLLNKDMPAKVKSLLEARFKTVGKKSGGGLNASIKSNGMSNSAMKQNKNELSLTNNSSKKKNLQTSLGTSLQFKKQIVPQNKLDKSMKSDNQISGGSIPDEQPQEDDFQTVSIAIQKVDPKSEIKIKDQQLSSQNNQIIQNLEEKKQLQDVFYGKKQLQNDSNKQDQEMIDESQIQQDEQAIILSQSKKQNLKESEEIPIEKRKMNTINLEHALNEAENKLELDIDPELRKQMQFILNHINQLRNGDLLKRVDSLVALNEVISGLGNQNQADAQNSNEAVLQQKALIKCCDDLIHAFSSVMNDIFNYPIQEIPLRFTKYFITIVNKTCSQKEIMREVSYKEVSSLVEQLLTRLLIDNLDKIGSNKEGELILKNLNSSMLRMLENCSHTFIFVVLFELLTKYKDDQNNQKVPSLIIKCLLKLSKNMEKIIEKIDLKKFLVAIHEYLASIGANRSNNDDLGMRIAKTLVNEIVKLKKDSIWKFFEVIENHQKQDQHLKKWIQIILRSLQDGNRPSASIQNQMQNSQVVGGNSIDQSQQDKNPQSRMYIEFEIKKIIQELNDPQKYENAIQKLDKFSKVNPTYDFTKNLQKESNEFAQQVKFNLNQFRNGQSNISTNNTSGGLGGAQQPQDQLQYQKKMNQIPSTSNIQNSFHAQRQSNVQQQFAQQDLNTSLNKQSAFQSKMAQFQKRQSTLGGMPPQSNQNLSISNNAQLQPQPSTNNLNTSFSDLNQKLSNQWANIQNSNKKTGQFTGRPTITQTTTQLAQTINIGTTGVRNSAFIGQSSSNQLNTSNNQFKNRLMQGNLVNRLQTKVNNNDSLGAQGEETGIIGQKNQIPKESIGDQNKIQSLNKSSNVGNTGGISNNSFRSRIQGFQKVSNQATEENQSQSQPSQNTQQPVTSVDLQKRLADMKAKLQGLKKE